MQSWGTNGRFTTRPTEYFPTVSGVAGILLSALGVERRDSRAELLNVGKLELFVREDKRGKILKDYQTVNISTTDKNDTKQTYRYYLSDYIFTVGLVGDDELLEKYRDALSSPKEALFLGRKSFVPSVPVLHGIFEYESPERFLTDHPLQLENSRALHFSELMFSELKRSVVKTDPSGNHIVMDVPVDFSSDNRQYLGRVVSYGTVSVTNPFHRKTHDPMEMVNDQ